MDPVTQGVFGSLWAQAGSRGRQLRRVGAAGFVAGMAPDLDVLIRSQDDALLFIDYHRHFTHAIPFAPIGGLLVALALWPVLRRELRFTVLYLACFLGYLSHGLLDAFTSYGTHLGWPFTESRVALSWISVIDPLFTLPLLVLLVLGLWRRRRVFTVAALAWATLYLGFGAWQQQRAEQALLGWMRHNNIVSERYIAKPSFANLLLWRGLIDEGSHFRALAIRQPLWGAPRIYEGARVAVLASDSLLPEASRGARDVNRFAVFSDGWVFRYAPREQAGRWFIGDFRYAMDPASERPLWGIYLDPTQPDAGVRFERLREVDDRERERFMQRLRGD